MEDKIILIDWNVFVFRSIFAWRNNKAIPPTYTALSMLISCLKKIGCHPDDTIILAIDSPKGSWRKQIDVQYKANRKEAREKFTDINWSEMFGMFRKLIPQLVASTPFIPLELDNYEADDIIAVACRHFKDKKCIIVSSDSDYEQLAEYKNVRLFSPSPKHKRYKTVTNPIRVLQKKIAKEQTDNLVSPILNEADYIRRQTIVNLLKLPPDVEREVSIALFNIEPHDYKLELFPFKSLGARFMDIYNSDEVIDEGRPEKKKKKKMRQLTL
jgi:5'-3' exonuclease